MSSFVWLVPIFLLAQAPVTQPVRPAGDTEADILAAIQILLAQQKRSEQELQTLRKELTDIRALLEEGKAADAARKSVPGPSETISIAGAPTRGRANAPLVMIEYADFECPFCGTYSRDTFPSLDHEFIQTGKLLYAFKHFPLEHIHKTAFGAAVAGECAQRQGKFWELHDRLFASQQHLGDDDLVQHAIAVGITAAEFHRCLTSDAVMKVRDDMAIAQGIGIRGTPTFVVGTLQADGRVRVSRIVPGALPYLSLKGILQSLMTLDTTSR